VLFFFDNKKLGQEELLMLEGSDERQSGRRVSYCVILSSIVFRFKVYFVIAHEIALKTISIKRIVRKTCGDFDLVSIKLSDFSVNKFIRLLLQL
jgi:hypothetical protein